MNKSDSIKNLASALIKFQNEIKNPGNTAVNPYFNSRYAPLHEILNEVRPVLAKYGLSVVQFPGGDGTNITVQTVLMHESGEWITGEPLVLKADKPTAQGAGSAITYGRRYALSALLGIASEDDDDGNIASNPNSSSPKASPRPKATSKSTDLSKPATSTQQEAIKKTIDLLIAKGEKGLSVESFLQENFGKTSLSDLTFEEGTEAMKKCNQMMLNR